jgi:hypothetical protein
MGFIVGSFYEVNQKKLEEFLIQREKNLRGGLRKYANATAFRSALEDRLKAMAHREGPDLQRLRRQVAFDRLLARLFSNNSCPWVLKGGYALEVHLKKSRTTRDIDLAWQQTFNIGDIVIKPAEKSRGIDWLRFAGIAPPTFRTIPREQHFAEKLHAYTQPRQNPNSRVRDLVDMVLLIKRTKLNRGKTQDAIKATFKRRGTHSIPRKLSSPPLDWNKPFSFMSQECDLSMDVQGAFQIVNDFHQRLTRRL